MWWWKKTLIILAIYMLRSNAQSDFRCCPEKNQLSSVLGSCVMEDLTNTNETMDLYCEHGSYLLSPSEVSADKYEIKNKILIILDSLLKVEHFCETEFINEDNSSARVAVACFTDYAETSHSLFLYKGILAFISVVFIAVTLYIYWLIPGLRETLDKVTCIAISCLMIFLFFLGYIQAIKPELDSFTCVPFAFLVYFFTIAYFAWLNIIMINMWKHCVMAKWTIKEKHWYILNHLYGWTVPITCTAFLFATHFWEGGLSPNFGVKSCWFAEKRESWILLFIPISIMLFINIVLFVWSIVQIRVADLTINRKKLILYRLKFYVKLFILAGLTWIFEVFSHQFSDSGEYSFWLIGDIFNALQGVLVFLVLVIGRKRVRRELAGRKICCCITGPNSWEHVNNPEEEGLQDAEGTALE